MSSSNPFGGPNPFADPAVTVHTESAAADVVPFSARFVSEGSLSRRMEGATVSPPHVHTPKTPSAWGNATGAWGASTASPSNGKKPTKTERELSKREAEIKEREKQLEERQQELQALQRLPTSGAPVRVKNWPPCYPFLYHDIEAEIPVDLQSAVKRAYQAYLLFCFTVLFNLLCLTFAVAKGGDLMSWVFAGLYVLAGVPGAFIVWYGRIYRAACYDRSITFMCYFFGAAVHIAFSVPVAVLPGDDSSFTGLIEVLSKFDDETWLGAFYLIGFVLWAGNVVVSILVWQQAMRLFRGRGGPQQVQNQVQQAAGHAVIASATQGRV